MQRSRGLFIVLEGADGCGKSTQSRALAERLEADGESVIHVRDPGTTRLAEGVRALLLDPAQGEICVPAETFLYLAARAQLVHETIAPALAAGTHVVCERWTLSTEVYQGLAGGLGAEVVRDLATHATGGTEPDLVLVLDVAVGGGLERVEGELDRMERKGEEFHAAVVRGYRELAQGRPRHVVIPSGGLDEVRRAVAGEVLAVVG